jgi:hypothetical protein
MEASAALNYHASHIINDTSSLFLHNDRAADAKLDSPLCLNIYNKRVLFSRDVRLAILN